MNQDRSSVFAIIAAVAALFLLQAVLWRFVSAGARASASARLGPVLQRSAAGWPACARVASRRDSLKTTYPRAYAVFAARFVPTSLTGLPLTLMCLGAICAAALLAGLIDDLGKTEGLVGLDHGVNAFFAPYRTPALIEAFMWITALGAGPATAGVVTVASALLWSQGQTRLLLPLWITVLGAQGTTWAAKYAIGRPRPAFLDAVTAASPSFPSGHATAATALIGFLAYVIARGVPDLRARFEVVFWSAAIIGLICFSRIFLSLHYVSDVAAGLLVGVFWLLVGFAVTEFARRPNAAVTKIKRRPPA